MAVRGADAAVDGAGTVGGNGVGGGAAAAGGDAGMDVEGHGVGVAALEDELDADLSESPVVEAQRAFWRTNGSTDCTGCSSSRLRGTTFSYGAGGGGPRARPLSVSCPFTSKHCPHRIAAYLAVTTYSEPSCGSMRGPPRSFPVIKHSASSETQTIEPTGPRPVGQPERLGDAQLGAWTILAIGEYGLLALRWVVRL